MVEEATRVERVLRVPTTTDSWIIDEIKNKGFPQTVFTLKNFLNNFPHIRLTKKELMNK